MRIQFLGKGGSGKTTTAAAFIKYLDSKNEDVIAIDADLNVHLQHTLGIEGDAISISENFKDIAEYLEGDRNLETPFLNTTPPSFKSKFVYPTKDDALIKKYALQKNNISLLTVGKYIKEDLGAACYHGKLGSLQSILHHMIDGKGDWIVSDATAGTDIGTSLFFAYDLNVIIVEPTVKSVQVFKDFLGFSEICGLQTRCIINKYREEDESFINEHLDEEYILGRLPLSENIRKFEQGDLTAFDAYIEECSEVFDKLITLSGTLERDWDKYLKILKDLHRKSVKSWYNDYYSQDLEVQIDEDFAYNLIK